MNACVVHSHLNPGGVTRVIENAVAALAGTGVEAAVLCGEPYGGGALDGSRVGVVEGLGYRERADGLSPAELAARLDDAAGDLLGGAPDVWHVHNHALGKNVVAPAAYRLMAGRGARFLFQVHDFAEDGRPENYRILRENLVRHGGGDGGGPGGNGGMAGTLYPRAPHVHYGALNGRDLAFLRAAGVPAGQAHLLANPVALPGGDAPADDGGSTRRGAVRAAAAQALGLGGGAEGGRLYVYPTRGIRRKNLGEVLLWAALAPPADLFVTTRAPEGRAWLAVHDFWVQAAEDLRSPCLLGAASHVDLGLGFMDWVRSADALITTSVAEGFGLAFLEPWLLGQPLLGRDLPEITADFARAGVDLSGLYRRLEVPLETVGEEAFNSALAAALETTFAAYARPLPDDAVERASGAAARGGWVDFGRLDEPLQRSVIEAVMGSPTLAAGVRERNRWKERADPVRAADRVTANRRSVEEHFAPAAYGRNLAEVYRAVAAPGPGSGANGSGPVDDALDGDALLDQFIDPARFFLLRS